MTDNWTYQAMTTDDLVEILEQIGRNQLSEIEKVDFSSMQRGERWETFRDVAEYLEDKAHVLRGLSILLKDLLFPPNL